MKFANMEQTELEKGEGIEPLRALQKRVSHAFKKTTYTSIGVDLPEHVALVENIKKKTMCPFDIFSSHMFFIL